MGYAKIVGGGADGRYSILLDFGKAQRDAAIADLGAFISKMEIDLAAALAQIAASEASIQPLRDLHTAAINAYIEAAETLRTTGSLPPGTPSLSTREIDLYAAQIKRAVAQAEPLRRRRDALRFLLKTAERDLVRWTNVVAESTRDAWCTTLTEDGAIDSFVATVDIPGDSNLVLIAPECRGWQPSDGYLRARAVMSPEQAFWNAAVQPGWQKFKPTYRWGTATSIDYEANTMNVALFDQKSDAQQLSVNQASTLSNVPVVYLACHASAFDVDDRVVVQFQNQDWNAPRVIGFLDNPKRCGSWVCVGGTSYEVGDEVINTFSFESRNSALHSTLNASLKDPDGYEFGFGMPLFTSTIAQVQVKPAGGTWRTLYVWIVYGLLDDEPYIAGAEGTAFTPAVVTQAGEAKFSVLSGYLLDPLTPSPGIIEWEPAIDHPSGFTHQAPGPQVTHSDLYGFDVYVDFAVDSPNFELRLETFPTTVVPDSEVPEIVELRVVENGVTKFHAAVGRFDGAALPLKILDGYINTPPGYSDTPLTLLDYEIEP